MKFKLLEGKTMVILTALFIYIYIYNFDYNKHGEDEGNSRNEIWHWTNNEIGLALVPVGSECELNSWPDSSVG